MSPPVAVGTLEPAKEPESFERFVSLDLAEGLREMGILAPNAIQADAVPLALSGRDLMVVAQTGSGKTLVFLLPILQRLLESAALGPAVEAGLARPEALVLAPTGELAAQVVQVALQLTGSRSSELAVARLPDAVACSARLAVATPEEVQQELQRGALSTERLRLLAIDEADAILCGSGDAARQVDRFLREVEGREEPPQLFLTMAHLTQVREDELVRRFPSVQRVGHIGVLVPTLRQCFHYFRSDRDAKLLDVLGSANEDAWLRAGTTLVFCARAETVERLREVLAAKLRASNVAALHDGMQADDRSAVYRSFRSGASRILLTTDSAARGLDFPQLRHVVMYDVPSDITAFVHCAGRTARRGQQGLVTCLVQTEEASLYQFDFKSHHGLQPAVQLHFQHAKDHPVAEQEVAEKGEEDTLAPAKSGKKRERVRQPKQKGKKEQRHDPLDGQPYTLEELQWYYRRQYSEAEVLAYWHQECTPVFPRR